MPAALLNSSSNPSVGVIPERGEWGEASGERAAARRRLKLLRVRGPWHRVAEVVGAPVARLLGGEKKEGALVEMVRWNAGATHHVLLHPCAAARAACAAAAGGGRGPSWGAASGCSGL